MLLLKEDCGFVPVESSILFVVHDERRNTDGLVTLVYTLDAEMSQLYRDFELLRYSEDKPKQEAVKFMPRADNSGVDDSALGIVVLVYFCYPQSKLIPLESMKISQINELSLSY
ncbi:hypothetical protein [Staphylococcus phage vB_SauH_DELF3]|nr:hypothetical protein [Staphylococcus phage vB_SauH_DELF3]